MRLPLKREPFIKRQTLLTASYNRFTKSNLWKTYHFKMFGSVNQFGDIRFALLMLRLTVMAAMVALLTLHLRTVRVFRWEQSVSGGVFVTYLISSVGLALCAGSTGTILTGIVVQCYLCATGAALLILNAITLWSRWRRSGDLTHAVADLLSALGVPVRKQMLAKISLSIVAACALIADMVLVIMYKENIRIAN